MMIDEAIKRYSDNAEYERAHGSLQGCLDFKQLAEWLKDYKRLLEQEPCDNAISRQAVLDKIKTEISEKYNNCDICEWYEDYDYEENSISEYQSVGCIADILEIIDKHLKEVEE